MILGSVGLLHLVDLKSRTKKVNVSELCLRPVYSSAPQIGDTHYSGTKYFVVG